VTGAAEGDQAIEVEVGTATRALDYVADVEAPAAAVCLAAHSGIGYCSPIDYEAHTR